MQKQALIWQNFFTFHIHTNKDQNFFTEPQNPCWDSEAVFHSLDIHRKKQTRLKRCGTICVRNIFNVPHVLVVRGKKSRIWSLPKGCMNTGENEIQCAQRETAEEAGLFLDLSAHEIQRITINHNIYFIHVLNFNPKLRIRDKSEIDKIAWMTLNELQNINCNKDLRSILQYPLKRFAFHNVLEPILQLHDLESNQIIVA